MGEYVQALAVGHQAGGLDAERTLDGVGSSSGRESLVYPSRPREARVTGWARRHTAGLVLGDLLAALACSVVVSVLAHHIAPGQAHGWRLLLLWGAPVVWVAVLGVVQAYNTSLGNDSAEYRVVTRALLLVAAALGLLFLVADVRIPRDTVVPLLPAMFVASLGVHYVGRRHLYQRRLRGECLRPTIVVGRVDSVRSLVTEIATAPESGMHIVGACVSGLEGDAASYEELLGVPVLGSPESALEAVDAYGAEVVAVSSHPDLAGVRLRRLGWALAERQVELVVAPGIVEVAGPRLSLRPAAGVSLLHVERPLDSGARVVAKRIADAAMTGCLLVVALPVLLVIAVLVRVTSPGPVFYLQERVGTRGERFRMVKFRTMVVGADSMVATMSGGHDTNAVLFKQRQDPRVTAVGRVLRKYSLDELPQLFNVLVGQMSLVGPRPPLPREVDAYEPDAVQRLRVRPGMTGLWQISGRSDLSWEQSLRLDLWYVDNWSLVLDLQILVRTVKAVVRHTGAY